MRMKFLRELFMNGLLLVHGVIVEYMDARMKNLLTVSH